MAVRRRMLFLTSLGLALLLSALPVASGQNGDGFRFPENSNCSCATSDIGYYEVHCPITSLTPTFLIKLSPGRSVEIQCTDNTSPSDYSWLPEVILGHGGVVDYFSFRMCPLPSSPLIETINRLGVRNLTILYFQTYKNLTNSLTRNHLNGLQGLSRLVLSSNGLTDLPEDIFDDLTNLTILNLRSNKVHLTPKLFASLPNLKQLELGHNAIRALPEGLFRHMKYLVHLNLWHNSLRELSPDVFKGLNELEELDLSSNEIQTFPSDVFHFLPNLTHLNLFSNNLSSLPGDLFSTNQRLKDIRLFDNKQSIKELPEYFLSNLTQLREVFMYRCHLQRVPETLFWDSFEIVNVSLMWNDLSSIPSRLFKDQRNLIKLDLSHNKITSLPDEAFASLTKLEWLMLDYNQIDSISGKLFSSLSSLKEISMEHNNLRKIAYNAFVFTKALERVNLAQNQLSFLEEDDSDLGILRYEPLGLRSPLQHLLQLQFLNLSRNAITDIFYDWREITLHLKMLDLSYNSIMAIEFNDINFKHTVTMDLRHNNISEIDFVRANIQALANKFPQPDAFHSRSQAPINARVLIDDNPLVCDCVLFHFIQYLNDKLDPQVRSLVEVIPGNAKCSSPTEMLGKFIRNVEPQELLCPLDDVQSHLPRQCPDHCTCFVRAFDKALIVNCSSANFLAIPAIPDAIERTLNHTELDLSDNNISSLPVDKSPAYDKITNLFLDHNNISELFVENMPSELQNIDLRRNKIQYVKKDVVDLFANSTSLMKLWISGNPIVCDCENYPFLSFMQTYYDKIADFPSVKCRDDDMLVSKLSLGRLCGTSPAVIAISIIFAILGLVVGILAALYYKYQQEVKVWLFSKGLCLWWVTEEEVDKDKLYDAFISFSHKDEEFVINKLVNTLESGSHPFKICVHFRDWVAGEFIPNQIAKSVEDSRRTLVILSPNFLESVWGRMEFRAAHSRALKEGRARVVIILYGDIGSTENLDAELQAYLSMNTYVKWGDPWFWDKLRYALPHPPHRRSNVISNGIANKKGFDDRLELIHPTTPTTPPAENTPPAHQAHTNPLMNHVNSIPNGNGKVTSLTSNGTITMNGLKINGNAKHSDV